MKVKFTRSLAWAFVLPIALVSFSSCKKDSSSTTDNTTPAKALNKTTLTPKKWYSQGSSIIHDFKAGGVYASTGSWSWKNSKSDTMEIITQAGFPQTEWKIFWNTDHEMNAMRLDQHVEILFKDAAW